MGLSTLDFCSFVGCFRSRSKYFAYKLNRDVNIVGDGLQEKTMIDTLIFVHARRDLYRATLTVTRALGYAVSTLGPPQLSRRL